MFKIKIAMTIFSLLFMVACSSNFNKPDGSEVVLDEDEHGSQNDQESTQLEQPSSKEEWRIFITRNESLGDFDKIDESLMRAYRSGDRNAQLFLSNRVLSGESKGLSYEQAIETLRNLSVNGSAEASVSLAALYLFRDVPHEEHEMSLSRHVLSRRLAYLNGAGDLPQVSNKDNIMQVVYDNGVFDFSANYDKLEDSYACYMQNFSDKGVSLRADEDGLKLISNWPLSTDRYDASMVRLENGRLLKGRDPEVKSTHDMIREEANKRRGHAYNMNVRGMISQDYFEKVLLDISREERAALNENKNMVQDVYGLLLAGAYSKDFFNFFWDVHDSRELYIRAVLSDGSVVEDEVKISFSDGVVEWNVMDTVSWAYLECLFR